MEIRYMENFQTSIFICEIVLLRLLFSMENQNQFSKSDVKVEVDN